MKAENLINRTSEYLQDKVIHKFKNGFELITETFMNSDPNRVLPIGGPQDAILNYLANNSYLVEGKHVFEPFAGSGVFGLMALYMGASSSDLLDINPHAIELQLQNADKNKLNKEKLRCIKGDINDFKVNKRYDLILANPPFVPTPEVIEGTVHSNGGYDGNKLCIPLIRNISNWLSPMGEALIYMSQIMIGDKPSLTDILVNEVKSREIEITIIQKKSDTLESMINSYIEFFSLSKESIESWKNMLYRDYGEDIGLNNCIIHIKPIHEGDTEIITKYNINEKFGFGALDQYPLNEVTKSRIRENVL